MRSIVLIGGSLLLAAAILPSGGAVARELGPHQHGHGRVNMALDGSTLWIELETPGADIVGFEHEAASAEDKAAMASAKATLSDPLSILTLPEAAGCQAQDASVQIQAEEHHDEAHEEAEQDGDHDDEDEQAQGQHSEFHVEYRLVCAQPDEITTIGFPYFDLFAGAKELDVTLLSDRGQSHYEVTAAAPSMDLGD